MHIIILLALLLTLLHRTVSGAPTFDGSVGGNGSNPLIVDAGAGKYQGVRLPNGVVQWLGMRYAGPPTGANRFAAPVPPMPFEGVQMANKTISGCQGIGPHTSGTTEDCLSIDVYAPAHGGPTSNLPVYVFIQGGGNEGATAHFNGSDLVKASDMNMVFVSFTYRVGAYGFLASSEVQANASLNNGYKDQRQALQWVKDHIAGFGGNPSAITLGGQSAGGGAAVSQLAAYGQTDNNGLFHAAIIQSPSMPPVRNVSQQQFQYDDLVRKLNCTSSDDTLACLRQVPHDTFLAQVGGIAFPDGGGDLPVFSWNPVLDNDFIPETPIDAFTHGRFVQVPTVIGDVNDEGTLFAPRHVQNDTGIWTWLRSTFPALNDTARAQLEPLYNLSSPAPAPFWHRASAIYGELRYVCPGTQLAALMTAHGNAQVWRYRFNAADPAFVAEGLDVFHGADMPALLGPGMHAGITPESYAAGQSNAAIVPEMQAYWSSFVRFQDPSVQRRAGDPVWTRWNGANQRLRLQTNATAMEATDATQLTRCDYVAGVAAGLQQ